MPSSDSTTALGTRATTNTIRARRRLWSRVLFAVQRAHLYLGLLLMPWALLYGVSGYLINHPTHFPETSLRAFGPALVRGTCLEPGIDAQQCAEGVLELLNARLGPSKTVRLDDAVMPGFAGDYVFASAESERQTVQLLLYRDGSGGTLYVSDKPKVGGEPPLRARFDVEPSRAVPNRTSAVGTAEMLGRSDSADAPLHIAAIDADNLKSAVQSIAARLDASFAALEFRVTSVPDLQLQILDGKDAWMSRYNGLTGALTSKPAAHPAGELPSWRRFLTRMHTAHGYPLDLSARWLWAIVVDAMSGVLVFWGISGLIMWWQIKRTRPWGTVALVLSILFALWLGANMMVGMR